MENLKAGLTKMAAPIDKRGHAPIVAIPTPSVVDTRLWIKLKDAQKISYESGSECVREMYMDKAKHSNL